MNVKEELLALGMVEADFGHHASDLHVRKTPLSEQYLATYPYRVNVTTFVSQLDHQVWYDFPFAFLQDS